MVRAGAPAYPFARERSLVLASLIGLAALAWAVLAWQSSMMDEDDMGLTSGMAAPLFLTMWVAMMVAMMFPTAAPMVLTFARVQANRRQQGGTFVPTWLFVLAYLALWTAFGIGAYVVATLGDELAASSMWLMDNAARIGGIVILVAGLYQLSPLKRSCLSNCRTPTGFIMSRWREGYAGALRMGLEHGAYCLGCCWLLFVILFPLGVMNVVAMALLTLFIFAEKSLAIGPAVARAGALGLVVYGTVVIYVPDVLPSMMI